MKIRILLLSIFISLSSSAQNFSLLANVNKASYNIRTVEIKTGKITVILDEQGGISGIFDELIDGNFDYIESEEFPEIMGKLSSVNGTLIQYYTGLDSQDIKYGKIKSIGDLAVEYFENKTEKDRYGKVKHIGDIQLDYWRRTGFDVTLVGKISRIGDIKIDYYNDQNDKTTYGQLKDIGPVHFSYWEDYYSSSMKVGRLRSLSGNSVAVTVKIF